MKALLRPRLIPDPEYKQILVRQSDGAKRIRYTGFVIADTTEELGVKTGEFANSVPTPQGVAAQGASTSVLVSWNAVIHPGLTGYEIYRDGVLIQTTTNISYTDEDVSAGNEYTYTIIAIDIYGDSSNESEPATAIVGVLFAPPTALTGESGDKEAILNWNAPVGAGTPTSYKVIRDNITVATVAYPTTTYTDTGLTNGTVYGYRVKADYDGTLSEGSNSVNITPELLGDGWIAVWVNTQLRVADREFTQLDSYILGVTGLDALAVNVDRKIALDLGANVYQFSFDPDTNTITLDWTNSTTGAVGNMISPMPNGNWVKGASGNFDLTNGGIWILSGVDGSEVAEFTESGAASGRGVLNGNTLHAYGCASPNYVYAIMEDSGSPNFVCLVQMDPTDLSVNWVTPWLSSIDVWSSGWNQANNVAFGATVDDEVILGTFDEIYKFDSAGNEIWRIAVVGSCKDVAIEQDGTFYMGIDGKVGKYTAGDAVTDPQEQWFVNLGSISTFFGPAFSVSFDPSGLVVVGSRDGYLLTLDPSDGSLVTDNGQTLTGGASLNRTVDVHPGNQAVL